MTAPISHLQLWSQDGYKTISMGWKIWSSTEERRMIIWGYNTMYRHNLQAVSFYFLFISPHLNTFHIIGWKDPDNVFPEKNKCSFAFKNVFKETLIVQNRLITWTHFSSSMGRTIWPAHHPASIMNSGRRMSPEKIQMENNTSEGLLKRYKWKTAQVKVSWKEHGYNMLHWISPLESNAVEICLLKMMNPNKSLISNPLLCLCIKLFRSYLEWGRAHPSAGPRNWEGFCQSSLFKKNIIAIFPFIFIIVHWTISNLNSATHNTFRYGYRHSTRGRPYIT